MEQLPITPLSRQEILEALADEARDSLSSYCINTCKALCCKSGHLTITKAESEIFPKDKKVERADGLYEIPLQPQCIHLKNNKCTVYENRPKPCRNFPVYVRGETILFASWCKGQQAGLLEIYIQKFKDLGCTVHII
jgi:Fe-S-cluster containining protein